MPRLSTTTMVPFATLLLVWMINSAAAQQTYIETDQQGYTCVTNTTSCQAYAAYRALQGDSFQTVGLRFGLSIEQLATASGIPGSAALVPGQILLIPMNCSCAGGRSQYNVTYIIQSGDTMYIVSNGTFQGLTTFQAVERANPAVVPTRMEPGDRLTFPIRCACPTSSQRSNGVSSLVTYSIWPEESLEAIASDWNVSRAVLTSENTPPDGGTLQNSDLAAFSTLLLPATRNPPALPQQALVPPPAANDSPPPAAPDGGDDDSSGSSSSSNTGTYVGVGVGCGAAVLLLAAAAVFVMYRRRTRKVAKSSLHGSSYGYGSKGERGGFDGSMSSGYNVDPSKEQSLPRQHDALLAGMHGLVDSEKPVIFSYEELSDATNGFSASHLIQGTVYRGVLRKQLVAIKEMKGGTTSQELKILCKVHHSNLVNLVGICSGEEKLFLVYEYADNGSLSSCLHNRTPAAPMSAMENAAMGSASVSSAFLSWNTRLQIAVDVATGLEYIHDYTKPSFVHKDLKCSNILLDANLRAKIANFGMARLVNDATLTKHIAGTQGYMSPEYLAHGFVTVKVDVYAFGVVLLELFTGREAIISTGAGGQKQYLADAFVALVDDFAGCSDEEKLEKLKPWADPIMDGALPWDIALRFVEMARSCIDADPDARPSMKDVTVKLSKLMESSVEWETAAVLSRRYNTVPLEGR